MQKVPKCEINNNKIRTLNIQIELPLFARSLLSNIGKFVNKNKCWYVRCIPSFQYSLRRTPAPSQWKIKGLLPPSAPLHLITFSSLRGAAAGASRQFLSFITRPSLERNSSQVLWICIPGVRDANRGIGGDGYYDGHIKRAHLTLAMLVMTVVNGV